MLEPPDCGCGFMSVERMRWLLDIDSMPDVVQTDGYQQLNPNMRFTCDGVITKWIIGAEIRRHAENNLFPELQVWRPTNNNTYQKINGTVIRGPYDSVEGNNIVFYNIISQPISVESGDILGVFEPQSSEGRPNRMALLSEANNSEVAYYIPTGDSEVSPYDEIDETAIRNFQPLISVEFGKQL